MFKRDTKLAWKGIKQLTGMKEIKGKHIINNSKDFCNDLYAFYSKFDKCDFSQEFSVIIKQLQNANDSKIVITNTDVLKVYSQLRLEKRQIQIKSMAMS